MRLQWILLLLCILHILHTSHGAYRQGRIRGTAVKRRYSHRQRTTEPHRTPVVLKKKSAKKRKIISVNAGVYVEGGINIQGKFKDLHSCQKFCATASTCFAGDYNPWLNRCYIHSNVTACGVMLAHVAIIHFKKVPCAVIEAPRSMVILGVSIPLGFDIRGITDLSSCIKYCSNAGNGIAGRNVNIVSEGQLCCNVNFDFANHKCYAHPCGVRRGLVRRLFCPRLLTSTPLNAIPNPSVVSISLCPAL